MLAHELSHAHAARHKSASLMVRRLNGALRVSLAAMLAACSGAIAGAPAGPGNASSEDPSDGAGAGLYVPDLTRRLTADEYANTIEDQLGVTLSAADRALLPPDRSPEGFAQIARSQATDPDHVVAYHALAERVVTQMNLEGYLSQHAACRTSDNACIDGFVQSAGGHLFRRPVTERERDKLTGLFANLTKQGLSFSDGARAVIQAALQFPQFLYLMPDPTEIPKGATRRRKGYELASRLSYYLWSSAPDAELIEAAERGSLDAREGLLAQVDRMLGDPRRAARTTARWLWDWAQLETTSTGASDERVLSATAFFQDYLWTRGEPLDGLLTVPRVFLTPTLAEADGIEVLGAGPRSYDTDDRTGRIGLLGQPATAAGMALGADGGQIVARGLFMLAKVFCGEPPPPPPAALAEAISEFGAGLPANASHRQISELRMENPQCAACHGRFDPLGFAFEIFDANGALQDEDAHGNAVVPNGWIPGYLTSSGQQADHANFAEYMRFAAAQEGVQLCLTRHFFEQALGAKLGREYEPSVREVHRAARAAGGRYTDQARAIATSDLFIQVATTGETP